MGIYTVREDPRIDACISTHLSAIVDAVRRELPNVAAIVLIGGFGRGEGSVLLEGDRVVPVNDYDIVLATRLPFNRACLTDLANRLALQVGIRHIDLIPIPIDEFDSLPPSQFNHDMKYGGKVLWGEDVLSAIPDIAPVVISLADARQLLINRAVCLLEGFPNKHRMGIQLPEDRFFSFNQTVKVVLACGEALLIQVGHYTHSYVARREVVQTLFPNRYELLHLHEIATSFKLRPVQEPGKDLLEFWTSAMREYTRTLCDIVLKPGTRYPSWRSTRQCLSHLVKAEQVSSIEYDELALIFAKYLGGWQGWWLTFQAGRNLKYSKFPTWAWNRLRQAAVSHWHAPQS